MKLSEINKYVETRLAELDSTYTKLNEGRLTGIDKECILARKQELERLKLKLGSNSRNTQGNKSHINLLV